MQMKFSDGQSKFLRVFNFAILGYSRKLDARENIVFYSIWDHCKKYEYWRPTSGPIPTHFGKFLSAGLRQTDIGCEQFEQLLKICLFGFWNHGALWLFV